MAPINYQFSFIFYDRFGRSRLCITISYVVIEYGYQFLSSELGFHPKIMFAFIFLQIDYRLPFDWKTPSGFLIALSIQSILSICVMVTLECLAIFGLGTCLMLFPLTKDMKNNLRTISHDARRKKNRSKIIKQFSQFIQFHSKLIQLSDSQ